MKKRRKKWNRKKKYVVSLIATLIILSSIYLMTVLLGDAVNKNALDLSGPYDVIRVVDGDTIIADIDGTETRIRLIGIDTPESVSEEAERNTPEGEVASEYMKKLLEGGSVYLEYDSELTDTYGRTLCYVYLHDRATMVNELLVRNGYARTLTIEPNTKYRERLYAAELSAKSSSSGFWETGFFK